MLKKALAGSMMVVLIHALYVPCSQAQSPTPPNPKVVEFRQKVTKRGVGKTVSVKLIAGNSLKGPITQITDDGFVVLDKKRGNDVPVSYSGVKSISVPHSLLFKVGVGAAVAGGVAIAALICYNSPSCYQS